MAKKEKKTKELPTAKIKYNKDIKQGLPVTGVYGVAILFVCVSILYANYIVFFGTEGLLSKVVLLPSTLFVAGFLVYKSLK